MVRNPLARSLFLSAVLLSGTLFAEGVSETERSSIVKAEEQRLLRDSQSLNSSAHSKEAASRSSRMGLRRIIAIPFELGSRLAKSNQPSEESEEPPSEIASQGIASAAQRRLDTPARATPSSTASPPETAAAETPSLASSSESPQPSRVTSLFSRILLRLGVGRAREESEVEGVAKNEEKQKWLEVLASREASHREENRTPFVFAKNRINEKVNPDDQQASWLGGLLGQTTREPAKPMVPRNESTNSRVLGVTMGDRKQAASSSQHSRRGLLLLGLGGDDDSSNLKATIEAPASLEIYRAIDRNRAVLHVIDPGSDATIPLEVDGGEVGRIHGSGDEWSWVQLESGLMGVMRNAHLRDAKKDEVLSFLAAEASSLESAAGIIKIEVADVNAERLAGSSEVGNVAESGPLAPVPRVTGELERVMTAN